jgi:hypothetical protein
VTAINLGDTVEPSGYVFKLKASEIASEEDLKNWSVDLTDSIYANWPEDKKKVNITFSDNFDWVNGGIQSEIAEDGTERNFICVRAGTTMTINYDLFRNFTSNVAKSGKTFKIIYKAVNCRDYEAPVLNCTTN